ncbi:MAG TPA: hypothetical protein VFC78_17510, partial [Tepidisphaeraceae bacterium]|nr:hypothetical protein [Tepidisphaeraceae bacterium]
MSRIVPPPAGSAPRSPEDPDKKTGGAKPGMPAQKPNVTTPMAPSVGASAPPTPGGMPANKVPGPGLRPPTAGVRPPAQKVVAPGTASDETYNLNDRHAAPTGRTPGPAPTGNGSPSGNGHANAPHAPTGAAPAARQAPA